LHNIFFVNELRKATKSTLRKQGVLLYYRQVKGQIEIPTLREPPEGVSAIIGKPRQATG
jgi:hypothetical protein